MLQVARLFPLFEPNDRHVKPLYNTLANHIQLTISQGEKKEEEEEEKKKKKEEANLTHEEKGLTSSTSSTSTHCCCCCCCYFTFSLSDFSILSAVLTAKRFNTLTFWKSLTKPLALIAIKEGLDHKGATTQVTIWEEETPLPLHEDGVVVLPDQKKMKKNYLQKYAMFLSICYNMSLLHFFPCAIHDLLESASLPLIDALVLTNSALLRLVECAGSRLQVLRCVAHLVGEELEDGYLRRQRRLGRLSGGEHPAAAAAANVTGEGEGGGYPITGWNAAELVQLLRTFTKYTVIDQRLFKLANRAIHKEISLGLLPVHFKCAHLRNLTVAQHQHLTLFRQLTGEGVTQRAHLRAVESYGFVENDPGESCQGENVVWVNEDQDLIAIQIENQHMEKKREYFVQAALKENQDLHRLIRLKNEEQRQEETDQQDQGKTQILSETDRPADKELPHMTSTVPFLASSSSTASSICDRIRLHPSIAHLREYASIRHWRGIGHIDLYGKRPSGRTAGVTHLSPVPSIHSISPVVLAQAQKDGNIIESASAKDATNPFPTTTTNNTTTYSTTCSDHMTAAATDFSYGEMDAFLSDAWVHGDYSIGPEGFTGFQAFSIGQLFAVMDSLLFAGAHEWAPYVSSLSAVLLDSLDRPHATARCLDATQVRFAMCYVVRDPLARSSSHHEKAVAVLLNRIIVLFIAGSCEPVDLVLFLKALVRWRGYRAKQKVRPRENPRLVYRTLYKSLNTLPLRAGSSPVAEEIWLPSIIGEEMTDNSADSIVAVEMLGVLADEICTRIHRFSPSEIALAVRSLAYLDFTDASFYNALVPHLMERVFSLTTQDVANITQGLNKAGCADRKLMYRLGIQSQKKQSEFLSYKGKGKIATNFVDSKQAAFQRLG